MEFHNPEYLPQGMHEIIAAFVPDDVYDITRIIAYNYPQHPPPPDLGTYSWVTPGACGYDAVTSTFLIQLDPNLEVTVSWFGGGGGPGTTSFRAWVGLLWVALHELGHLATRESWYDMLAPAIANEAYLQRLADAWASRAMARILEVDRRLGQPPGPLKVHPSVLEYDPKSTRLPCGHDFHFRSIGDRRGSSCGGQVLPYDIAFKLFRDLFEQDPRDARVKRLKSRLYRVIREAAKACGIQRLFVSKNGRRYTMFNAAEAELVYEWLCRNKEGYIESLRKDGWAFIAPKGKPAEWEFVDSAWELDEV